MSNGIHQTTDVTSTSRDDFIKLEHTTNPSGGSPYTTLNVWHGCDMVAFRWKVVAPISSGVLEEFYGIDVIEVQKGTHYITAEYSEFSGCTGCTG